MYRRELSRPHLIVGISGVMSSLVDSEDDPADSGNDVVDSNGELMNDVQVGRKFNLFEEVQELLKKLRAYNHPMRVFNSQSVDDYNKRRAKARVPLEPIDSKWKFVYYVIARVHFGQPRKKSKGIRCNQRHLASHKVHCKDHHII